MAAASVGPVLTDRRAVTDSAPEFVAVDGDWLLTVSRQTTPSIRFLRNDSFGLIPSTAFEPTEVDVQSTEAVTVALAGDLAAIGVRPHESARLLRATGNAHGAGHVLTYRRVDAQWIPDTTLTHPDGEATGRFGWSVAISGSTLVVGDPSESNRGVAFVYEHDAKGWTLSEELVGVSVTPSEDYGASVAIAGDTVAVGAPGDVTMVPEDPKAPKSWGAGAVHVFEREAQGKGFAQVSFLRPNAPSRNKPFCQGMSCRWLPRGVELFGSDVAIAGDWIVVGAPGEESVGTAHVFYRDPSRGMNDPWGLYDMFLPQEGQRGFGSRVRAEVGRIAVGCAEDVYAPGMVPGTSAIASVTLFGLSAGGWLRLGAVRTPVTMGAGLAEFDMRTDRLAVAGYRPGAMDFADVFRLAEVRP